jgi:hypothetical protein
MQSLPTLPVIIAECTNAQVALAQTLPDRLYPPKISYFFEWSAKGFEEASLEELLKLGPRFQVKVSVSESEFPILVSVRDALVRSGCIDVLVLQVPCAEEIEPLLLPSLRQLIIRPKCTSIHVISILRTLLSRVDPESSPSKLRVLGVPRLTGPAVGLFCELLKACSGLYCLLLHDIALSVPDPAAGWRRICAAIGSCTRLRGLAFRFSEQTGVSTIDPLAVLAALPPSQLEGMQFAVAIDLASDHGLARFAEFLSYLAVRTRILARIELRLFGSTASGLQAGRAHAVALSAFSVVVQLAIMTPSTVYRTGLLTELVARGVRVLQFCDVVEGDMILDPTWAPLQQSVQLLSVAIGVQGNSQLSGFLQPARAQSLTYLHLAGVFCSHAMLSHLAQALPKLPQLVLVSFSLAKVPAGDLTGGPAALQSAVDALLSAVAQHVGIRSFSLSRGTTTSIEYLRPSSILMLLRDAVRLAVISLPLLDEIMSSPELSQQFWVGVAQHPALQRIRLVPEFGPSQRYEALSLPDAAVTLLEQNTTLTSIRVVASLMPERVEMAIQRNAARGIARRLVWRRLVWWALTRPGGLPVEVAGLVVHLMAAPEFSERMATE